VPSPGAGAAVPRRRRGAAADGEADLDRVAVAKLVLAGQQGPVADHQHGGRQHLEPRQQVLDAADVGDLDHAVGRTEAGGHEHGRSSSR
jgi:hypothetical protein